MTTDKPTIYHPMTRRRRIFWYAAMFASFLVLVLLAFLLIGFGFIWVYRMAEGQAGQEWVLPLFAVPVVALLSAFMLYLCTCVLMGLRPLQQVRFDDAISTRYRNNLR